MKITNEELKKIIKEEIENVLKEAKELFAISIHQPDSSVNRYNIRLEDDHGVGIFSARVPLPGSPTKVELINIISKLKGLPSNISYKDIKSAFEKGNVRVPKSMEKNI